MIHKARVFAAEAGDDEADFLCLEESSLSSSSSSPSSVVVVVVVVVGIKGDALATSTMMRLLLGVSREVGQTIVGTPMVPQHEKEWEGLRLLQ